MTRFENVKIGQTFGYRYRQLILLFRKKSLSSAYTLDSNTQERADIHDIYPIVTFTKATMVFEIN